MKHCLPGQIREISIQIREISIQIRESHSQSVRLGNLANLITNQKCYDHHCPSLQAKDKNGLTVIEKRTCPTCGLYHSTIKAMKTHKSSACYTGKLRKTMQSIYCFGVIRKNRRNRNRRICLSTKFCWRMLKYREIYFTKLIISLV